MYCEKPSSERLETSGCDSQPSFRIPRVSYASVTLSVVSLVTAAICITIISETLYHRTLGSFARAALNSIATKVATDSVTSLRDIEYTLDSLVYAGYLNERMLPSREDAELARSGIVTPLGPSVANTSSGSFPHNIGSKIPNNSLAISTWREFFGLEMASLKLAQRHYLSQFDAVFVDGTYLTMATDVPALESTTNFIASSNPVLYDGQLLNDTQTNRSYYYVRRTPLTLSMTQIGFGRSTIVATSVADRREEAWYKKEIESSSMVFDVISNKRWLGLELNATSGAAWMNLGALLRSRNAGLIGKTRLTFEINSIGYVHTSFRAWIPLKNVQIYTISHTTEAIIGAEEFYHNPKLSLYHTTVSVGYALSEEDGHLGCVLTLNPDGATQTKSCRHSVYTYSNRVLQEARKASFDNFFDFGIDETNLQLMNRITMGVPSFTRFSCDGKNYYVSAAKSSSGTRSGYNSFGAKFDTPNWVTLAIVPQEEVTGVLDDVRIFVIIVTVGIVVVISIAFAVGTRMILGPVAEIASLMSAAAYLNDGPLAKDSNTQTITVTKAESIKKQNEDRRLSMFAEVRAIQSSYWAMNDELQALKAYIPEHLRVEIMANHRGRVGKKKESTDMTPRKDVPNDSNQSAEADEAVEYIEQPAAFSEHKEVVRDSTLPQIPVTASLPSAVENNRSDDTASQTYSIGEVKPATVTQRKQELEPYNPIFFADSCLVDRDITVVHVNLVAFHKYARRRHPTTISADYAEFITYISTEVRRFGGVLESFFGDKLWVSFNATSKCVRHQVAACYFALQVTRTANSAAERYNAALPVSAPLDGSKPPMPAIDPRFAICVGGVNCGVATGRAFVGPLGNSAIKRHTIISNAVSEATALERLSLQYSLCKVFVATDLLDHIEGYVQYMVVDASLLPGSQGRRRLVANVTGAMLGPAADASVVSRWLKASDGQRQTGYVHAVENPLVATGGVGGEASWAEFSVPSVNRYLPVNNAFRAMLSGNVEVTGQWLQRVRLGLRAPDAESHETAAEFEDRAALASSMVTLIETMLANGVDVHSYSSTLGQAYYRTSHRN